jgi:hypothetical protein
MKVMEKMLVAAALLASAGVAMAATGGKPVEVSEQIAVASRGGKVIVSVTFDNRGAHGVHVPKAVAEDGELFGKHFTVTEAASGKEVDYIGPMVKRGPYGPDDYLLVKPRSRHTSQIDITRAFAFLPGTHTYQLRHEGQVVADLKQVTAVTPVPMAPATFSHTQAK